MYCVKCGGELADSEKKCPLCGTPVFHPDIPRNLSEPPFPPDKRIRPEDVNRSGGLFVLTIFQLLGCLSLLLHYADKLPLALPVCFAGLLLMVESGASSARARELLGAELKAFSEDPEFRNITVVVNVDPQ